MDDNQIMKSVTEVARIAPVIKVEDANISSRKEAEDKKDVDAGLRKLSATEPTDTVAVVKKISAMGSYYNTKVSFDFDPSSGDSKIMVYEKDSGKLIRQIPPEELEKLAEKMDEFEGLLFNRRV